MFQQLVWATILVCVVSAIRAYMSTRDVFHPAILLSGLCALMYGYMPLSLAKDGLLFSYVTQAQAEFTETYKRQLGTFAEYDKKSGSMTAESLRKMANLRANFETARTQGLRSATYREQPV